MKNNGQELLKLSNINKSFSMNQVLKDVNFSLRSGEVHALLGANGAGKSTLMKIIAGEYRKDSGIIEVNGEQVEIASPSQSKKYGISVIHQELNLVSNLTVAENVYLGNEIRGGPGNLFISKMKTISMTEKIITKYNMNLDPKVKVEKLTVGQKQQVEILKAVSVDCNILVMDEPTAALSGEETKQLFSLIENLKAKGIGIIYISHRLDEIQEICNYVTILKDGKLTAEGKITDFSNEKIIECMVGKQIDDYYPPSNRTSVGSLLRINGINKKQTLHDISFELNKGEIVGLFGLVGAGQTELLKVLFGASKKDSGEIVLHDKEVQFKSPREARNYGIALLTENRREEGLILELGSDQNIVLASMKLFSRLGVKSRHKIKETTKEYVSKLNIKLHSLTQPVKHLSGGNQQKVILGKWLITTPEVILLSEPTRGIDIGARTEIYHLLNQIASEQKGILIASSDVEEVLGVSDRIFIMYKGKIVAELPKSQANRENLMEYASGASTQRKKGNPL